jgi:hypothetical protein
MSEQVSSAFHSNSKECRTSKSVNEFSLDVISALRAESAGRSKRIKLTTFVFPVCVDEILCDASIAQKTTKKAVLLSILNQELIHDLWNTTPSNATGFLEEIVAEITKPRKRRARRSLVGGEGYRWFSIKMPLERHRSLKLVATKYSTTMSRIIEVMLKQLAPYLTRDTEFLHDQSGEKESK